MTLLDPWRETPPVKRPYQRRLAQSNHEEGLDRLRLGDILQYNSQGILFVWSRSLKRKWGRQIILAEKRLNSHNKTSYATL